MSLSAEAATKSSSNNEEQNPNETMQQQHPNFNESTDDDDDEEDEEEEEGSSEDEDDDEEGVSDVSDVDEDDSSYDDSEEDDEAVRLYTTTNHYDEDALPEYACRYCGIHDPACVAKCVESGKWFCNSAGASNSSHLVHHLVRSRSHQVQLHPESPLGDTVLECYNCASKNAFVLGFVPASSSSVVVLLCRVCVETVPALKDMDWELAQWHPLIQDRRFLPWLVKAPSDALQLAARDVSGQQMTALEELWKNNSPDARYADLQNNRFGPGGADGEDGTGDEIQVAPALRAYEDGFHYQNIQAPLVKMEADYDRQMKESLTEESVSVRWEKSLAGKQLVYFSFHRAVAAEQTRIVVGDELRLKLSQGAEFLYGRPWEGVGYVQHMLDGEICLELKNTNAAVPEQIHDDYLVEYIWKSTSYDRMQNALKTFAVDDTSVTGYIYHKVLGHAVEEQRIATAKVPQTVAEFAVPGLPPLNESQMEAVQAVLQRPLSLIQGACDVLCVVLCVVLFSLVVLHRFVCCILCIFLFVVFCVSNILVLYILCVFMHANLTLYYQLFTRTDHQNNRTHRSARYR